MPIRRGKCFDESAVFRSQPRQSIVKMNPRQLGLDPIMKFGLVLLRVVERSHPNEKVLTTGNPNEVPKPTSTIPLKSAPLHQKPGLKAVICTYDGACTTAKGPTEDFSYQLG